MRRISARADPKTRWTRDLTMTNSQHVILAAGGTGGHIFPAMAVAEALLSRGYTISLFTDSRGINFRKILSEVTVHRVAASGSGRGIFSKTKAAFSMGLGTFQARGLLHKLSPCCIVGFGGYSSAPTVIAATMNGVPTVIHEQNACLGRANRLVASRVSVIATSFKKTQGIALKNAQKVVLTGNPVRRSFSQLRAQNYPSIDLNEEAIQILVLGGSLGAKVFSDVVPRAIAEMPENLRRRFVIVQQCRSEDIDRVHKTYKEAGVKQNLETFFENVSEQMAAAHIVISRAGASTIAELAEVGRPAILVPYPHAVDDHQTANARAVDDRRAGWHIPQEDFTSEYLTKHLERFVALPDKLLSAAEIAKSCGGRNSANAVADQVDLISLDRPNGGASANAKTVPGSAI